MGRGPSVHENARPPRITHGLVDEQLGPRLFLPEAAPQGLTRVDHEHELGPAGPRGAQGTWKTPVAPAWIQHVERDAGAHGRAGGQIQTEIETALIRGDV